MKGWVYLLLSVDNLGLECHKVGISRYNPMKRIKQLSTGNGGQISLLNAYESIYYQKIERLLHSKYNKYRTVSQNEWFQLPDEIVLDFLNECKKADKTASLMRDNPFF